MLTWLFFFLGLAPQGYHFADATIYDTSINSLREGVHVLVDSAGRVELVSAKPVAEQSGRHVVRGAMLLPHFRDFYSLVQERGLGFDEDLDSGNQRRMALHYLQIGLSAARDPVFPPGGLEDELMGPVTLFAQRGYLELADGPAEDFGLLIPFDVTDQDLEDGIPATGPITLWWTRAGTDIALQWPKHADLVRRLKAYFHNRGQKVGAYVQDADPAEMAALHPFELDFYEGLPADLEPRELKAWPRDLVWVPLAALNDRRYCAEFLAERLAEHRALSLYEAAQLERVGRQLKGIQKKIRDRCRVWKYRRFRALDPVSAWLEADRPLAIGSGGGHLFCFSGDLRSEVAVLEEMGAGQDQLMRAFFQTTPKLLGDERPYLEPGKLANFIVYFQNRHWGANLGTKVDMNFTMGQELLLDDSQPAAPMEPSDPRPPISP